MRPRKILRISRWEVTKGTGGIDRRTAAVTAVGLVLVLTLVPFAAGTVALDAGIYRIGVSPDHPLHDPVSADPTFAVREPSPEAFDGGDLEILIVDGNATYRNTEKGRAAVAELRRTVERHNDRRMAREENQSAAFPVTVTLEYSRRDSVEVIGAGGGSGGGGDGTDGGTGGAAGGGTTGDGGPRSVGDPGSAGIGGDLFGTGTNTGSPSDIAPPFPFQSLVLAFAFVVPLNFIIQAYSSSVLKERLNRRGELLLVAPVSRAEIIAGKTLPYLLAALVIATGITIAVGGGPLSVVAVAPLALLFLATAFLGAMFARSFKELTFVTVSVSVFLTAFAFVPAIFADASRVAFVSPLTLVVRDLSGVAVSPGEIAFAVLPAGLTALVLFGLGAGVYREEDMFTQRPVPLKALDALAARVHRIRSLVAVTALLIPFVLVAELLAVALLFAIPGTLPIVVLLALVALIEEAAKSLPVLAGFEHARYPRTTRAALLAGAASGLGFFLGEKLLLVVQLALVDLSQIRAGNAVFQTGFGEGPVVVAALLVAPLALHVVTAATSALGASRNENWYALAFGTAVVLHTLYNLTVVSLLG